MTDKLYTQSDMEALRERCAKVAEAEINEARVSGDGDLRSVKALVMHAIRALTIHPEVEKP